MKRFLSKKIGAFVFFFILSYVIGLGILFTMRMIGESKYEKEKAQAKKEMESELKTEEKTIYSANGITVRQLNFAPGTDGGFDINLEVQNDTDKVYYVFADDMRINGISVDGSAIFNEDVQPKSKAIIKFDTNTYSVKDLGFDKVLSVKSDLLISEVFMTLADSTNSFLAEDAIDVSLPGAEKLAGPTIIPEGDVIFEQDGVRAKLLKKDGRVFGSDNWFYLYVENTRPEEVGLLLTSKDPEKNPVNAGELSDALVNYMIRIHPNSAFYGRVGIFNAPALEEKRLKGEYLKLLAAVISVDNSEMISDKITEILLK